jgi:hypothetical protein
MSAVIKAKSLKEYGGGYSYSSNYEEVLIIIPIIKHVKGVKKEGSYFIEDGYFEIDEENSHKFFVFIVEVDDKKYIFKQESEAIELFTLIEKELEDFYQNYTNYVSVLKN